MPVLPAVLEYRYLGDKQTDPALKNAPCRAVRNAAGNCIRGRNGTMLVAFANGRKVTVIARLLRKVGEHDFKD